MEADAIDRTNTAETNRKILYLQNGFAGSSHALRLEERFLPLERAAAVQREDIKEQLELAPHAVDASRFGDDEHYQDHAKNAGGQSVDVLEGREPSP